MEHVRNLKKLLFVAPHIKGDSIDGAQVYCDWLVNCLKNRYEVTLVTHVDIVHSKPKTGNQNIKRWGSALKSIFSLRPYHSVRLVPKDTSELVNGMLLDSSYEIIYVSYLFTYFELRNVFSRTHSNCPVVVITHNYDPDIYANWKRYSFIKGMIGRLDFWKYNRLLKRISSNVIFGNIVSSDSVKFGALLSNRQIILPAPVPISATLKTAHVAGTLRFVFLGSLSSPLNEEALKFFCREKLQDLRKQSPVDVLVCGSDPSSFVKKLCSENNLQLYANLSNDELNKLLCTVDAGMLPFERKAGSKLKFYHYLSVGLPVVATSVFSEDYTNNDFVLCSDDPETWVSFVHQVRVSHNPSDIVKYSKRLFQEHFNTVMSAIDSVESW